MRKRNIVLGLLFATVQTNVYVDEDKVDTFTKLLIDRFNDQLTIKKGTSREHEIPYLTD